MEVLVNLAEGFISLFEQGADVFMGWMTDIVPLVLLMLVAMNALIQLIGENRINRLANASARNPILRYMVVPFIGAFMLGNPMMHTLGRFLPEKYKPSYNASGGYFCHTSNGIFPHINPSELFIWFGIANGVETLGLNTMPLAIRYLLVGLIMNFFSGWITDWTTTMVEKQQGIRLSTEVKLEKEG